MPKENQIHSDSEPTARTQLFSTPLFAVEQREYAGLGGITRHIVVHPGAVVILPVLEDGRIVMIQNYRYAAEQALLELPAGTRETNETPIETARRELVEETGYQAGKIEPFISFYSSPGVLSERMHAFVATELSFVGQQLEPGEQIVTEIVPTEEVRQKLVAGQFMDGKTIAVLGSYLLGAQRSV